MPHDKEAPGPTVPPDPAGNAAGLTSKGAVQEQQQQPQMQRQPVQLQELSAQQQQQQQQ